MNNILFYKKTVSPVTLLVQNETAKIVTSSFAIIDDRLFLLNEQKKLLDGIETLRFFRSQRDSLLLEWRTKIQKNFDNYSERDTLLKDHSRLWSNWELVSNDDLEKDLCINQFSENLMKSCGAFLPSFDKLFKNLSWVTVDFPLYPLKFGQIVQEWLQNNIWGSHLNNETYIIVVKTLEQEFNKEFPSIFQKIVNYYEKEFQKNKDIPLLNETISKENENVILRKDSQEPETSTDLFSSWNNQPDITLSEPFLDDNFFHPMYKNRSKEDIQKQEKTRLSKMYTVTPKELYEIYQNLKGLLGSSQAWSDLFQLSEQNNSKEIFSDQKYSEKDTWIDPDIQNFIAYLKFKKKSQALRTENLYQENILTWEEFKSILDDLQKDIMSFKFFEKQISSTTYIEEIRQNIFLKIKEKSSSSLMRLDGSDENALDLVLTVFELFLSERQFEENFQKSIIKLVIPYIQIAVQDKKMFLQKNYPTRQFLGVLTKYIEGLEGKNFQEKKIITYVNDQIDHICSHFSGDVSVFMDACHHIEQYVQQHNDITVVNEKRSWESQHGKEKWEQSKIESENVFSQKTYKYTWGIKIFENFHKYWVHYYTIVLVKGTSDEQKKALQELDQILKIVEEGISNQYSSYSEIQQSLKKILSASGITETASVECEKILYQLNEVYTQTPVEKNMNIPPPYLLELPIQNEEIQQMFKQSGLTITVEKHDELVEIFKKMPIGTWIDFVKSNGEILPTKLSWISPISHRLLFVTQRGTKYAVEHPEDLAKMILLDKIRFRDFNLGQEGFEHSYHKALEKLIENPVLTDKNATTVSKFKSM